MAARGTLWIEIEIVRGWLNNENRYIYLLIKKKDSYETIINHSRRWVRNRRQRTFSAEVGAYRDRQRRVCDPQQAGGKKGLEDAGLAYIQTRFYRYLPFPRTGRCRRRHCLSEERKKIKPSHWWGRNALARGRLLRELLQGNGLLDRETAGKPYRSVLRLYPQSQALLNALPGK